MILGSLRIQDSPLLSRIMTGFGRELDQMIWLPSRAGYLKLLLGILICPFGSLVRALTHVLTLGIIFFLISKVYSRGAKFLHL
jgi:hypothetical protein